MRPERRLYPYIDRGKPGTMRYQGGRLLEVTAPPSVQLRRLALEVIRRHNSLEPELQATNRILLRWGESAGTGLPNPEAETRETHYDPLPPDLQEKVTIVVDGSPWSPFARKVYLATLTGKSLAEQLGLSRTKFYSDLRSSLWFFRGRFEAERIYG